MLDVVILAAGMGTRMKSELPKVLHPVAGRPMILEVLATARMMEPRQCVVVVGHGAEQVRDLAGDQATFVLQEEQLGTGHAVRTAVPLLINDPAGTVLVLYGDTPLITPATLRRAVAKQRESGATVTLISFVPIDPSGYGRVVRDETGAVVGIVEHKDATAAQREIRECNSGIMLFEGAWLRENLPRLSLSAQGEYYLTDLTAIAVSQGKRVEALVVEAEEVMGVNNRVQLAEASELLWKRRRAHWLLEGVTMVDPSSVWLDAGVTIGRDTVIHQNVVLRGRTSIGDGCVIGPNVVLDNAIIGTGCQIVQSHLRDTRLADGRSLGPFAVLVGE